MARYVNKRTGAIIDTDCKMLGDWVLSGTLSPKESDEKLVQETPVKEQTVQEPEPPSNPTGASDAFESITKNQIMQELDAFGITYDKRATKQVLYDLMMAQGE